MAGRHAWSGAALLAVGLSLASLLGLGIARSAKLPAQQLCFGNLARLAQATLMYVAEHDGRFPPHQKVQSPYTCQWGADNSNPWLRWPVLLDPYLHDRSVYLCEGVEAPPMGHGVATRPGWITTKLVTTKGWPNGPCGSVWPPGWGGTITDSSVQGPCSDPGRFRATVGAVAVALADTSLAAIKDPRYHVLWADSSRMCINLGSLLWANACRGDCADLKDKADWQNCSWTRKCGAAGDFPSNPVLRARFTRHNGGSNIAFADGHVEWQSVPQMVQSYRQGRLGGVLPAPATKGKPWYLKD